MDNGGTLWLRVSLRDVFVDIIVGYLLFQHLNCKLLSITLLQCILITGLPMSPDKWSDRETPTRDIGIEGRVVDR